MARGRRDSKPGPGAELERLKRGLAKDWPAGLTLLEGDSGYHVDRAQRALITTLASGDGDDLSITVFGEDRVDLAAVVAAARSRGMFAPRRVVLVRDVSILEGEIDVLQGYLDRPPPQSHLIVRAHSLDRRRKLHQELARTPLAFAFFTEAATSGEIERDFAEMVRERGLTIDRTAGLWLLGVCAANYGRIESELDKLCAWAGDSGARIDMEVVRDVAAGSEFMDGWELARAILVRDRPEAYAALRGLLARGREPLMILGGIGWHSRALIAARARVDAGESLSVIINDLRIWHIKDDLAVAMKRFTLDEALGFPAALRQADRSLKSTTLSASAILERLIDRLVAGSSVEVRA